jgi:hypothetical protein
MGKKEARKDKRSSGSSMLDALRGAGFNSSEKPIVNKQEGYYKKDKQEKSAYSDNDKRFINPYTFVPILKKEPDRIKFEDLYIGNDERLDGCIECSMETKSNVFVPNTSKTFINEFNDFFSYEDLSSCKKDDVPEVEPKYPRIPGSEIRGMVRNVYEQLTNSCLSVIDDKNLAVKRSAKPKEAGIWDRENDILYKAIRKKISIDKLKKLGYEKGKNYITGSEVYITYNSAGYVKDISFESFKGATNGIILKGESFGDKKKNESVLVFSEGKDIVKGKLSQLDKERFKAVLDRYTGTKDGKHKGYVDYKDAYNSKLGYLPVFYSKVGDKLYLAPAMMTKEVFENTISELLEKNHFKHQLCNSETGFCPACRLFGNIANEKSIASRLRFTDTKVFENAKFDVPRMMPVLGTPRYSSTEFYIEKPEYRGVAIWNYDYYTVNNNKGIEIQSTYEAHLKGRKVYWQGTDKLENERSLINQLDYQKKNTGTVGKNNMKIRTSIRALKPGAKTSFKVYFEDVTKEELAALLYSLSLGEGCNHRIGRGKPYGMGAVKVDINKVILREYNLSEGKCSISERQVDAKEYSLSNEQKENVEYIEKYAMPLSEMEGTRVSYPEPLDGKEIFKWFANNRGSVSAPKIEQTLPDISAEDKFLNKNIKERK